MITALEVDCCLIDDKAQANENNNIDGNGFKEFVNQIINKVAKDEEIIQHQELKDALIDLLVGVIDIIRPEDITIHQQKILAKINTEFVNNIQDYFNSYKEGYKNESSEDYVPTFMEYQYFLNQILISTETPKIVRYLI